MQWHKVWDVSSVVGLTPSAVAGRARVSTGEVMMRGPGLPKPELIIVHDYQVSRDEVQLDSGIGSRIERLVGIHEDPSQARARWLFASRWSRIALLSMFEGSGRN